MEYEVADIWAKERAKVMQLFQVQLRLWSLPNYHKNIPLTLRISLSYQFNIIHSKRKFDPLLLS